MNAKDLQRISKTLSYVLRHRPDSIGVGLEAEGWIEVQTLLAAFAQNGQSYTRVQLEQVVLENNKQRFEFDRDRLRIRARQGHSLDIDLGYEAAIPPDNLLHGTATRFLDSILEQGLLKCARHHVHMSTNKDTMLAVGMRHGQPVILSIDARQMHNDGHQFFVTGNQVWLTDHVPPGYLTVLP
ncbi:MAG TPA: RNA 2'-phosphotransferase [Phycisphaerae bacterium]|nr:RNA 2'-phosphotransferase [Phycisphaerae bacterium]